MVEYRIDDAELVVIGGGVVRLRGRPDGHAVEKVAAVPRSCDANRAPQTSALR